MAPILPISDECVEEIEALEAIFDSESLERISDDSIRLRVAPEPDGAGHRFAEVFLHIKFPDSYPADASPSVEVSAGERCPESAVSSVQSLADATAANEAGGVVIFFIADAIREWLQENTQVDITPPPSPKVVAHANEQLDDFDVDSSDLDDELIEALQEVLAKDAEKLVELRRVKKLAGAEQRTSLRRILKSLTAAQRDELVGSDSESDDASDEPKGTAKAVAKPKPAPTPSVKLSLATMECPAGHELTAYSSRPPDYRKFDDGDYTCDVCGRDGSYKHGVYHCTRCFAQGGKQFDACPACGSRPAGGGGGKKQKGKNNAKKK